MGHGIDVFLADDMHRMDADLSEVAGDADKRQATVICHDSIENVASNEAVT